jgi:hypothetical protein
MRKVFLALAISALMMLEQSASAVDLEAGWYAKFGGVLLNGLDYYDPDPMWYASEWSTTSPLGPAGPLLVAEGGPLYSRGCAISVPQDTSVAAGVLFQGCGYYDRSWPQYDLVTFCWETNYDAAKLRLELVLIRNTGEEQLLWYQGISGHAVEPYEGLNFPAPLRNDEDIEFRLVAVPEPSSAVMVSGLMLLVFKLRRRRA